MTKLVQRGLTSKTEAEMNLFADRIDEFNREKGFVVIEAEARESPDGLWEWELQFASRAYANAFWTDPKYRRNIKTASNDDMQLIGE